MCQSEPSHITINLNFFFFFYRICFCFDILEMLKSVDCSLYDSWCMLKPPHSNIRKTLIWKIRYIVEVGWVH